MAPLDLANKLARGPGEFATQGGPLSGYPTADRGRETDYGYRNDAKKDGVLDQSGALFILADLVD
jgi:hypothetical protein